MRKVLERDTSLAHMVNNEWYELAKRQNNMWFIISIISLMMGFISGILTGLMINSGG